MGSLTLLHLSDLHYKPEIEYRVAPLIKALLEDITGNGISPDAVIFSGDVSYSGKVEQFRWVAENVIKPLAERFDLAAERFFIAPGNHDIDQSRIDQVLEAGFSGIAGDEARIRAELQSGAFSIEDRVPRLAAFDEFHAAVTGREGGRLNRTTVMATDIGSVGVASINTAWRATGAPDDDDAKRLLVGMPDLEGQFQRIVDCDFRIAAFHHPPDWLHPTEQRQFEDFIQKRFHLIVFGHMHDEDPRHVQSPIGTAFRCQSGCLDGGTNWPATYSVISIESHENRFEITRSSRRYEPRREVFESDLALSSDGTATYTLYSGGKDEQSIAELRERCRDDILDRARKVSLSPNPEKQQAAADLLVSPLFRSVSEATGEAAKVLGRPRDGDPLDVDQVAERSATTIVSAEPESGLTGSLLYLAERMMLRSRTPTVVVEAAEWSSKAPGDVGNLIARDLPSAVRRRVDLDKLDLVLDGVDIQSGQFAEGLAEFAESHAGRLVVGAAPGAARSIRAAFEAREELEADVLHLASMTTASLPQLAGIVLGKDGTVESEMLDRVVRVVDIEGLPRRPHVVGALIRVLDAGTSLRGHVSEPSVIEAYTEELLGRHVSWEAGEALDYEMRIRCLGLLAAEMAKADETQLSVDEAGRIVGDFLTSIGSAVTAERVLSDQRVRQVLVPDLLSVEFRIPAVRKLLAAKTLDDSEVASLAPDNHDSCGVVRYRAGISRASKVSLEWASQALPEVDNLPISQLAPSLPNLIADDAEPDEVVVPPAPDGEVINALDAWSEEPAADRARRTDTVIACLSSVVRDSDMLPDVAGKVDALEAALDGWWHLFDSLVRDQDFLESLMTELKELELLDTDDGSLDEEPVRTFVALAGFFSTMAGAGTWLMDERTSPLLRTVRQRSSPDSPAYTLSTLLMIHQEPGRSAELYKDLFEAASDSAQFLRMLFGGLAYLDYCYVADLSEDQQRALEDLLLRYRFGMTASSSALDRDRLSRARTELSKRRTQAQMQGRLGASSGSWRRLA